MEPLREMSIYTDMILIPLVLIVHIPILGPQVLSQQTFMPFMKNRVLRHFIPSTSSRVDLLIRGVDWLVSFLAPPVMTLGTDDSAGL